MAISATDKIQETLFFKEKPNTNRYSRDHLIIDLFCSLYYNFYINAKRFCEKNTILLSHIRHCQNTE